MTIEYLNFAKPFFYVSYVCNEPSIVVTEATIILNLDAQPLYIQQQKLHQFQSVMVCNTSVHDLQRALCIAGMPAHNNEAQLLSTIKDTWPLAYEVRKEARLKGVQHYISPREILDGLELNMYLAGSVPLKVGLHQEHYGGLPLREVHTQIVGVGKMQQCLQKDIETLYLEEYMAPGNTHRPIYDDQYGYPWHQYETLTEGVFMAVEMRP